MGRSLFDTPLQNRDNSIVEGYGTLYDPTQGDPQQALLTSAGQAGLGRTVGPGNVLDPTSNLGQFLQSRAATAQKQFMLRQALQGGGMGPAEWKDYLTGFARGYTSPNQPSSVVARGQIGDVLGQLQNLVTASQNGTMGDLTDPNNAAKVAMLGINADPSAQSTIAQTLLSLYAPHMPSFFLAPIQAALEKAMAAYGGQTDTQRDTSSMLDSALSYLRQGGPRASQTKWS